MSTPTITKTPIITSEIPINLEKGFNFYNDRYKYGYEWSAYAKLSQEIINYMKVLGLENDRILDVGCGVGWFTDYLFFNISKNTKGFDFSDKAIQFHAKRLFPAVEFQVADLYKYDYSNFDAFVMMEVMEHIDDIKLLKLLPKGGKIFLTVPFEKQRKDISHLREYSHRSIKERYKNYIDMKCNIKIGQFIFIWGIKK